MKKFIFFSHNRKLYLFFTCTVLIGYSFIYLLITAAKTDFEPPHPSSTEELDFLDVDLLTLNQDAKFAFEKKSYKEAAKKYIEILHHKPSDIETLYNLASCYALLKKPELAARALNYALDAGLNDISGLLSDSVWVNVKDNPIFKSTFDKAKTYKEERGEPFYAECKVLIRGCLKRPDNYDSTKAYPLLILLHGYGSYAESYMSVRNRMSATNFFVAAPQGPYPQKLLEINSPSYSWFCPTKNKDLWNRADPMAIDYILNVIDEIKSHYKISGVYLLGHSQGGGLAYMTGINVPDKISGIICIGAGNPKDLLTPIALDKASKILPVFIGHGWNDPRVSFDQAQQAKYLLKDYQFNVTFKPFKGEHWLDNGNLIEAKRWIDEIEAKRGVSSSNEN
ncbi:MAG: alpha/beta fold hydrolase [Bacteroidales bacterium]|nr:alpha/beta fold hydrolase [Bacteroidales bacterium]